MSRFSHPLSRQRILLGPSVNTWACTGESRGVVSKDARMIAGLYGTTSRMKQPHWATGFHELSEDLKQLREPPAVQIRVTNRGRYRPMPEVKAQAFEGTVYEIYVKKSIR
jgi:hypothetical protein